MELNDTQKKAIEVSKKIRSIPAAAADGMPHVEHRDRVKTGYIQHAGFNRLLTDIS